MSLLRILLCALLTDHINAIKYNATTYNPTACNIATINDLCSFNCNNATKWNKATFHCGDAGICNIYCTDNKCLEDGIIYANNSKNGLNVYSESHQQCYKESTFYLPNNGDANFYQIGSGDNPFKEVVIYSGLNTQNIYIECNGDDKDECKEMIVNAESAQYLYINASNSQLNGKDASDRLIINCPQNSNYDLSIAPCIIDVSGTHGNMLYSTINTLYGIPNDLWIIRENNDFTDVTLECLDGTVILDKQTYIGTHSCWQNTQNPTTSPLTNNPTLSPTDYPTPSPTNNPIQGTLNPTNNPTPSPTDNPTPSPTDNPTPSPTNNPTPSPTNNPIQGTLNPVSSPTDNPAPSPTDNPTPSSSNIQIEITRNVPLPSEQSEEITTTTNTATSSTSKAYIDTKSDTFNDADFQQKLTIILILVLIICCMSIMLYFVKWKIRKRKNEHIGKMVDEIHPKNTNELSLEHRIQIHSNSVVVSTDIMDKSIMTDKDKLYQHQMPAFSKYKLSKKRDTNVSVDQIEGINNGDNGGHIDGDVNDKYVTRNGLNDDDIALPMNEKYMTPNFNDNYRYLAKPNDMEQTKGNNDYNTPNDTDNGVNNTDNGDC